jgi:hypothetical protein
MSEPPHLFRPGNRLATCFVAGVMARDNYDVVRSKVEFDDWIQREPLGNAILELLDALNADQKDSTSPAAEKIRRERWWNS